MNIYSLKHAPADMMQFHDKANTRICTSIEHEGKPKNFKRMNVMCTTHEL